MRTLANAIPKKLDHLATHDEAAKLDFPAATTVSIARRLPIPTTTLSTNLSPAESEAKALHPSPPSFSRPRAEGAFNPRSPVQVHQEEQHVTKQLPRVWHQGSWFKETCLPLSANKPKTSWIPETGRGVPEASLLSGVNQERSGTKGALPSPTQQTRTFPIPCQEKVSQPGSLGVYNNWGFSQLNSFDWCFLSAASEPRRSREPAPEPKRRTHPPKPLTKVTQIYPYL